MTGRKRMKYRLEIPEELYSSFRARLRCLQDKNEALTKEQWSTELQFKTFLNRGFLKEVKEPKTREEALTKYKSECYTSNAIDERDYKRGWKDGKENLLLKQENE